jgi:REP element-mobilizing transposase RayT
VQLIESFQGLLKEIMTRTAGTFILADVSISGTVCHLVAGVKGDVVDKENIKFSIEQFPFFSIQELTMPRGPRLDAPGTLHHVIFRGIETRCIVDNDQDRERLLERLGELVLETRTALCALALMDNHAHLPVKSGPAGLAGFMRRLLTGHAVYCNRRHRRHGHLFQNRYKSIVCEEAP